MAEFLVSVSPDIPWHVTAFHKDYKMTGARDTAAETLVRAAEIGKRTGLGHVYAGNLPGEVGDFENTWCPGCHELLVGRSGYRVTSYHVTADGRCRKCAIGIPGRWDPVFRRQLTDHPYLPATAGLSR